MRLETGKVHVVSRSMGAFRSRLEAGELLGRKLAESGYGKAVVLGILRGGVVVAIEAGRVLESGVDIVICHKLGAPGNAELAFGAVCEGGVSFVNERLALYVGAGERYIEGEKRRQLEAIRRKVEMYRAVVEKIPLEKRVVIVTDDGVATGATMQAALWAVRREKPEKIVLALPVGSEEAVLRLSKDADETICLKVPPYFDAVGRFYVEFGQVEDSELLQLLADEMERRNAE